MLISKKMILKPLIESADGVHLTVYLVNRGKLIDSKKQLREAMDKARDWLNPVMSAEEISKFLEPLDSLLKDSRIFKQMKGNIGIYRNHDLFRVLNVPVDVEQACQVATSFHVKPLLRWLQADPEFLLLGIEQNAAHLYLGSQDSLKLVDSILFPQAFKKNNPININLNNQEAKQRNSKEQASFNWMNAWISQFTKVSRPKLFVAGEKSIVATVSGSLHYKNIMKTFHIDPFSRGTIGELCTHIRKLLRVESRVAIEKALMEFRFAEEGNRARKNIFQISKAVVQGRVRKLIVSDELSIFGKIDKQSGGLAIHPADLDHEDDDILDDLAQMVLSQGGEVVVASKNDIPKGRPILAILEEDDKEIEKIEDFHQIEVLDRFG